MITPGLLSKEDAQRINSKLSVREVPDFQGQKPGNLAVSHYPNSSCFDIDSYRSNQYNLLMLIVDTGPKGGASSTLVGGQYWGREVMIKSSFDDAVVVDGGVWTAINNLSEINTQTGRALYRTPPSGINESNEVTDLNSVVVECCLIDGVGDTKDNGQYMYVFSQATPTVLDAIVYGTPTAVNGLIRWRYQIKFGDWKATTSTAVPVWTLRSPSTVYTAWNEAESRNTFTSGTGRVGSGFNNVKQSDGTVNGTACVLQPLADGDYVQVKIKCIADDGTPVYTIVGMPNTAE